MTSPRCRLTMILPSLSKDTHNLRLEHFDYRTLTWNKLLRMSHRFEKTSWTEQPAVSRRKRFHWQVRLMNVLESDLPCPPELVILRAWWRGRFRLVRISNNFQDTPTRRGSSLISATKMSKIFWAATWMNHWPRKRLLANSEYHQTSSPSCTANTRGIPRSSSRRRQMRRSSNKSNNWLHPVQARWWRKRGPSPVAI